MAYNKTMAYSKTKQWAYSKTMAYNKTEQWLTVRPNYGLQ